MSLNPFVDDRDDNPVFKYYKGSIMTNEDSEENIDKLIENTMRSLYKDTSDHVRYLVHKVIITKINSINELCLFKIARTIMKENDAIELDVAFKWITKFSLDHQFGKYGPVFMIKYIEPILDTRDNKVFGIRFRDLAYDDDMWKLIPDEWKSKDGNLVILFLRDKMEDGFRNLYERLLFLEYIVKGELPK